MNVLLHICCAPCAIYPARLLNEAGLEVKGFFYNPNIHPYSEYLKRKDAVLKYSVSRGFDIEVGDYEIENYFQHIVHKEAARNRCPVCWRLRLEKCAKSAKNNNIEYFTTTLLGSPYQDHETIKNICEDIAKKAGVKFYYKDFRSGFKEAHGKARSMGMYCQYYCGCIFSEKERLEKKAIHS